MQDNPTVVKKISQSTDVLNLGAGLAGLTAAYTLTKSGCRVTTIEKNHHVGGLARTLSEGDFRFDIGGHRFLTNDVTVDRFVKNILGGDYLVVPRSSKILLNNKYFQYPLKPLNSIFGFGINTSINILLDYAFQKLKNKLNPCELSSLEDWVVQQFGETMFSLYFRDYSEKVWGIPCNNISKEWIAQRIQGLSLGEAIKAALNLKKKSNKKFAKYTTLTDNFIYPHLGIGAIAERLHSGVVEHNAVLTNTSLIRLNHSNKKIDHAVVRIGNRNQIIEADEYISSIPINTIVNSLYPRPPQSILQVANSMRYRDLVIVTLMLNQERVTDQTWIYFPDKNIPFGRIHEPTNWSAKMAPPGKTSLVAEYFCFRDDEIWNTTDDSLAELTKQHLQELGLIDCRDVIGSKILRIPHAYPLFEVGFQERCDTLYDYLEQFENLSFTGRSGKFRYYNMDHTIRSGMDVAQKIIPKIPVRRVPRNGRIAIAKEGAS
ncbi:FAD-dependent oxidoreductase [Kaarinaea lacus]